MANVKQPETTESAPDGPEASILRRIRRAASMAELRMRLSNALRWAPVVLTTGLTLSAVLLAVHKVAPYYVSEAHAVLGFTGLACSMVAALGAAFLRRLPPNAGTLVLDKHHGLLGRLTNAVEFAAVPKPKRTELMSAALEEACAFVSSRPRRVTLAARKASPITVPLEIALALAPAAALVGIALLEIRTLVPEPPPVAAIDPLLLSQDDIDLFREVAKDLQRPDQSPEVKAAVERFNRLVEDLADRRLDRTEAFRQMESIERELLAGAEADQLKLDAELRETARQLEKSDLTAELAAALKEKDLKKAEQKLKELAEKLRSEKKPDKAQLQKLRDALKKASERRKEALKAIDERRQEIQEQLLQKRKQLDEQKDPEKKEEEERLLKKKERELERLDRESEQQQRANKELERLDRELAEAAEALMKELGITKEDLQKAAENMEQGAEELNRMEREGTSQRDKEELKKKLEELREILRQQQQGGKKRQARLDQFGKRARGKGSKGKQGQPGEPGEEGEGEGPGKPGNKLEREMGDGDGEEGDGENGKGKGKGKGQGDGDGEIEISIGPGGTKPGAGPGQGEGQGGPGDKPGDGGGKGGKEAGKGSGGNPRGAATDSDMDTIDVHAEAADTGQGKVAEKAIQAAADRGFRGSNYKDVYRQYKTVAEDSMRKEQIPDGYRFYVQRYFQLIRPRD